jgi:methylmalonyl-CoA mutase
MNPLANLDLTAATIRDLPVQVFPFLICAEHLEAEGASVVHELAFALASGIEYLAEMNERSVETNSAAKAIAFSFSIGASFFPQIAKFRAFRDLWAEAVTTFGGTREAALARVNARTSTWNKTVFDPHVNVLRTTTETMSAVLGGVDSVCVAPFDECYKMPDAGSRRLARNTQLMLKQEALLTRVKDPGAGSYYLESITASIGREAWKLMQRVEAGGGYRKAAASGLLDSILEESRKDRDNAVIARRRVFTGTNRYADPMEKALGRIDTSRVEAELRGTLSYEQLRLRTERFAAETGRTPRVLLAEFGDMKMRAARSNFAVNFFACAGFEIAIERFENAQAIVETDADLIVLCSADAEYLEAATALMFKLNSIGRDTPVIVAGNPEMVEQLRAAGVSDFIHIRSNPIEVLTRWQQRLGMRD